MYILPCIEKNILHFILHPTSYIPRPTPCTILHLTGALILDRFEPDAPSVTFSSLSGELKVHAKYSKYNKYSIYSKCNQLTQWRAQGTQHTYSYTHKYGTARSWYMRMKQFAHDLSTLTRATLTLSVLTRSTYTSAYY